MHAVGMEWILFGLPGMTEDVLLDKDILFLNSDLQSLWGASQDTWSIRLYQMI